AEIGTSLTQRGVVRSVTFATPRVGEGEGANNWSNSIAAADAGAIYMGAGQATSIARELVAAGMSALLPVAIVENASLPDVRVIYTTLAALPKIANAGVS